MSDGRELRVIVEPDEDGFVAQCIDYDIFGIGSTPDDAIQDFVNAFLRHVLVAVDLKQEPLSSVPQPGQEYRDHWYGTVGKGTVKPKEFEIPRFTIHDLDDFDDSTLPHRGAALIALCA